jgi:hypothetical protein
MTVSNGNITETRGTTWTIGLTVGDISTRDRLYFTVKQRADDADADAVLQVEETDGLLRFNGAAATAGDGAIAVTDAATGALTVTVAASTTQNALVLSGLKWDVKMATAAGVVEVMQSGLMDVGPDATGAID